MIVALALLMMQADAAVPPDVVVVAERMRRFHARTRKDRRTAVVRCDIRRSSGDAAMDGAICEAMLACSAAASSVADTRGCMSQRMPAIMARFAPGNPPDGWSVER